MKLRQLAVTPILLAASVWVMAQPATAPDAEQPQKKEQVIQGQDAGGHAQTTIIDANGNLKMVNPADARGEGKEEGELAPEKSKSAPTSDSTSLSGGRLPENAANPSSSTGAPVTPSVPSEKGSK